MVLQEVQQQHLAAAAKQLVRYLQAIYAWLAFEGGEIFEQGIKGNSRLCCVFWESSFDGQDHLYTDSMQSQKSYV